MQRSTSRPAANRAKNRARSSAPGGTRLLPWILAAAVAACAQGSREATLIEGFFAAARLQDTSALSSLSRVSFNPRVDGTVQRFAVTNIGAERRDGSSITEEVEVDAQVRTPEGATEPRTLVFTLERPSDESRWTITAVRPRASRTSRGASSAPPN